MATTTADVAVAMLIEASARTPSGTCAWFPSFGILDLLEKQIQSQPGAARPHLIREAISRLNQTIEIACGGSVCKVLSIVARAEGEQGAGTFDVKVVWNDGEVRMFALGEKE